MLTDLANSSWIPDQHAEGLDKVEKAKDGKSAKIATFILRLGGDDHSDVAVLTAQPAETAATQGQPLEIRGLVKNLGTQPARRVVEFYIDGDTKFPTICGTGTEDYFCGSYNFENRATHKYQTFSTPYTGLAQVIPADEIYQPGQCFGLYRWHISDPIRFHKNLKVTIQALGWKENGLYERLNPDMASVAYWYQKEPHAKFPELPGLKKLDGQ